MNKRSILIFSLLFFLSSFFIAPNQLSADAQNEEICYSQCAAYKFVWEGDYCWDTFQRECVKSKGDGIKEMAKFLKSVKDVLKSGKGVINVFTAWFACKPLIENCIAPQLAECVQTCDTDMYYYAPDLSVGHPDGHFRGVVYDRRNNELIFKLINVGLGYAWDIQVEASYGYTFERDDQIQNAQMLFSETVEHLIYFGARNGPPKVMSDHIKDFLIERSNFTKYLQNYKSDAKDYNVPNYWMKTVSFQPVEGALNQVIFNVDPSQHIAESNRGNNSFVFNLDLRPEPARFSISEFDQHLTAQTLNSFLVSFQVNNHGEESGAASIKIIEGRQISDDAEVVYQTESNILPQRHSFFETSISIDVKKENTHCGNFKDYLIIVTDEDGNVSTRSFQLPVYSGVIMGRVKDLFDKRVIGATIKASTGEETTTTKYGTYQLRHLDTLGKITLTASHPDYSQPATQEVNLQILDEFKPCDNGSLLFTGINFVLKDQDVNFTATVRNTAGDIITANLLATNEHFRIQQEVDNRTALPELQPGEYFFTISAPGYKTIGQSINAVPHDQDLEFVLEPLHGRPNDAGLSIHEPILLWTYELENENLAEMAATKDGKTVIMFTTRNRADSGKLYFFETMSGEQRAVVETISNAGNYAGALGTSYDGQTTALCSIDGNVHGHDQGKSWIKLFNSSGSEFNQTELKDNSSFDRCTVSPDGFYIAPFSLFNKGFYQYTRYDMLGSDHSSQTISFGSYPGSHFTTSNQIYAGCPKGEAKYCLRNLDGSIVYLHDDLEAFLVSSDSNQAGNRIAALTNSQVAFYSENQLLWLREVKTHGSFLSVSVTPGGNYVIYSTHDDGVPHRQIKIFTHNNLDKTPTESQQGGSEDTVLVSANDKGIFYAAKRRSSIKFYQVGSYAQEYNPEQYPTPTIPALTYGVSYYAQGSFHPMGAVVFSDLSPGVLYYANQNIVFNLPNNTGSLRIQSGSLFGVNHESNPVLIKGQMTPNADAAIEVFAIKINRYDLDLFAEKLEQFVAGNLNDDEYFVMNNVLTRWTINNQEDLFSLKVARGTVQLLGKDLDRLVRGGRQLTIDGDGQITESLYITPKMVLISLGGVLFICGGILFYYRKTKTGRTIIKILKKIITQLWRAAKYLGKKIFQTLRWLLTQLSRGIKLIIQKIWQKIKSKKQQRKRKKS